MQIDVFDIKKWRMHLIIDPLRNWYAMNLWTAQIEREKSLTIMIVLKQTNKASHRHVQRKKLSQDTMLRRVYILGKSILGLTTFKEIFFAIKSKMKMQASSKSAEYSELAKGFYTIWRRFKKYTPLSNINLLKNNSMLIERDWLDSLIDNIVRRSIRWQSNWTLI